MALVSSLPISNFLLPTEERPEISFDCFAADKEFPLVDFSAPSSDLAAAIDAAAREYGFFQLVNHGVGAQIHAMRDLASTMMEELPPERKQAVRISSSARLGFITGGYEIRFWHEGFQVSDSPDLIQEFSDKLWPDSPANAHHFRETTRGYISAIKGVGSRLLGAFAAALGVRDRDPFADRVASFRINRYPACPEPSAVMGMPPHRDRNFMAVLHQDEVGGLQIYHKNEWFGLKPRMDALVIILGDALQAMSNANYKSLRHRVVANNAVARMSLCCFIAPSSDAIIAPLDEVIDEDHPAVYKSFTWKELTAQSDALRIARTHIDISSLEYFKVPSQS